MLITFEGIDCSGKTTALQSVREKLEAQGLEVFYSREPGGTPLGEEVRNIILQHATKMAPETETMLFYTSRVEHCASFIRPALERGAIVLCDRYYDSSLAYQTAIKNFDFPLELHKKMMALGVIDVPAKTLLFDMSVETYLERKGIRGVVKGEEVNNIEDGRTHHYFRRVIQNFRDLANNEPERFSWIDATKSIEEVGEQAYTAVLEAINNAANISANPAEA